MMRWLWLNVLALIASGCGGELPNACETAGLADRACKDALVDYCLAESEEEACLDASELDVGNDRVKCVWGYTATITDADSCTMTPGGRCYAVPLIDDGPSCEDFCEDDTGSNRFLYRIDDVLVRLPCVSGVHNHQAPLRDESVDAGACYADDTSPESPLCECAESACDVLK